MTHPVTTKVKLVFFGCVWVFELFVLLLIVDPFKKICHSLPFKYVLNVIVLNKSIEGPFGGLKCE